MTRNQLAKLYNIDASTLRRACAPHRKRLEGMANYLTYNNRRRMRRRLNRAQINFIVKTIMQDPPEGYRNYKGLLKKINEDDIK